MVDLSGAQDVLEGMLIFMGILILVGLLIVTYEQLKGEI